MQLHKRIALAAMAILLAVSTAGCSRVSAGHVGISSKYAGAGRGMDALAVGPAWVPYNPISESIMEYPTYVQTAVWTANKNEGHPENEEISFSTKDKMAVTADISIAYSLTPEKVPAFYLKFRTDDLEGFTHGFLHNLARGAFDTVAGKYTTDDVMGDNAPYLTEVRATLQTYLTSYGVTIEQIGFIGTPRPPAVWIEANNMRVKATQLALQKQNEVVQAEADAKKQVASANGDAESTLARARAQAEANRILGASITPTLVEYRRVDKWDGTLPLYGGGGNGGMGVLLQAPTKSK